MPLTPQQAKAKFDGLIATLPQSGAAYSGSILTTVVPGKIYEAWTLGFLVQQLIAHEASTVTITNGSKLRLRSSGGGIDRGYTYLEVARPGRPTIELWTDIQFTSLSYHRRGMPQPLAPCDHHELDIVAVPVGTAGRPRHDQILLGIECKHTPFAKHMARAALGVRRELSYLQGAAPTAFGSWLRASVPARPPSVLAVFSSDGGVTKYQPAGDEFGVDFYHLSM
jgi:hypothetical protein